MENNSSVEFYMKQHFQLIEFSSDRTARGNVLSRIHNTFVEAINNRILFPKIILVVLDNDMVKKVTGTRIITEKIINDSMKYLIQETHELITDVRKQLPQKAKKFKYPSVIWMTPPTHMNLTDNTKREQLSKSIETLVMRYNEMRFMRPISPWDFNTANLAPATASGYKFSGRGLVKYWQSINKAVQYWNTVHSTTAYQQQGRNGQTKKWAKKAKFN